MILFANCVNGFFDGSDGSFGLTGNGGSVGIAANGGDSGIWGMVTEQYPKRHWIHVELDALAVDIVRFSPQGRASAAEVASGFGKAGADGAPDGASKAALKRCVKAGKLVKLQRGIYEYVQQGR